MEVKHFTQGDFEEEVINYEGKVLIDFWATWCGPCKMMAPVIDAVAEEVADDVKVGKVDVDENPELAAQYGIMSIPTIIIFENGQEIDRLIGMQDKNELLSRLK